MTRTFRSPLAAVAALLLAGCSGGTPDGMAVVDLDMVARAFGHDDAMQNQVNAATQQLSAQLSSIALELQNQLQQELDELGDDPDEEARADFEQRRAVAQQRLQATQLLAQQRADEFRARVINQFRRDIRGVASEVAKERGASVVLTSTTALLWRDDAVDITDEVIAELRSRDFEPSPVVVDGEGESTAGNAQGTGDGTGEQ